MNAMSKHSESNSNVEGEVVATKEDGKTSNLERYNKDPENQSINHAKSDENFVTGFKLWIIMGSITAVLFLMLLDTSILSTAIPVITSDFQSLEDIGWYGAAYQLAGAAIIPLTGKVYSNFDTKRTFFAFFFIFEVGSLLCGVSVSSNMLIVGRAVAGIGAAGLQSGSMTITSECVPMPKRPMWFGIIIGGAQLGLVVGPLIGGVFTEFVTWRWCFYINLPIGGAIAAILFLVHIPTQTPKPPPLTVFRALHRKLDLVGFMLFAASAIMLLVAVQYGGNQYPWNSSVVIGLFCGAGVSFAIWLGWDYHMKDAGMIPLSMLKNPRVWSSSLVLLFLYAAMFTTSYYLPVYFQGVLGKSPAISGVYLLPSILSQLFANVLSGKAMGHFGYYLPWAVASAAVTAIGYGLLSTLGANSSTGAWIGYQILFGAGRGLGQQAPLIAVQNAVMPAQIPVAMGLSVFSQTLGGALFLSLSGTIFTNSLRSLLKQDVPSVNSQAVIEAGAYGFRSIVSADALAEVLDAYAQSIDRVFYMCTGCACACFAFSWALGWTDIRKRSASAGVEHSASEGKRTE